MTIDDRSSMDLFRYTEKKKETYPSQLSTAVNAVKWSHTLSFCTVTMTLLIIMGSNLWK